MVGFDNSAFNISKSLFDDIAEFVDERYVDESENLNSR